MKKNNIDLIRRAFSAGAYSTAYDFCMEDIHNQNAHSLTYIYRTLAELSQMNIEDIYTKEFSVNIRLLLERIENENNSAGDYLSNIQETLEISFGLINKFKQKREDRLADLQRQFRGSAGISIDSDDPDARRHEDEIRSHNNVINRQIHALNEKYEEIATTLIDAPLKHICSSEWFLKNRSTIPLTFVESVTDYALMGASEETKNHVLDFCLDIKQKRNERYWQEHKNEYDKLASEKENIQQRIERTIKEELHSIELEKANAEEAKKHAKKERKRYSIFNFSDRKPQNAIISKSRAIIKRCEEAEKELLQGNCAKCSEDQKRLQEINDALTIQR